jgi:hypothetical protein
VASWLPLLAATATPSGCDLGTDGGPGSTGTAASACFGLPASRHGSKSDVKEAVVGAKGELEPTLVSLLLPPCDAEDDGRSLVSSAIVVIRRRSEFGRLKWIRMS